MHDPRAYGIEVGQEVLTNKGVSRIKWIGSGLVVAENGDHIDIAALVRDGEAERRVEALKHRINRRDDLDRVDPIAFLWIMLGTMAVCASIAIVIVEY